MQQSSNDLTPSSSYVCLAAVNPNPGSHFAAFAEVFRKNGRDYFVIAGGSAQQKFEQKEIKVNQVVTSLADPSLLETVGKLHQKAKYVLVDGGDANSARLLQQFTTAAPEVKRYVYYDNPESFVSESYSKSVQTALTLAQGIVFANANLVNEPVWFNYQTQTQMSFEGKEKIGVGLYFVEEAEALKKKREDLSNRVQLRESFFKNHELRDTGQKLIVYSGGNHPEYFEKAFPYFLLLLKNGYHKDQVLFENTLFIFQQHPMAKKENKKDGVLLTNWEREMGPCVPKVVLSSLTTDQALEFADAVCYFQSSMSPKFVLAGIPTFQVNYDSVLMNFLEKITWNIFLPDSRSGSVMEKERAKFYQDVVTRNGFVNAVIYKQEFVKAVTLATSNEPKLLLDTAMIKNKIGIREEWQENLLKI